MIKKFKTNTLDDMNYCTSIDYDFLIDRLVRMEEGCVDSFEFDEIQTLEDYANINRYFGSRVKELLTGLNLFIVSENEIVNDYFIARNIPNCQSVDTDRYVLIVTKNVELSQLLIY